VALTFHNGAAVTQFERPVNAELDPSQILRSVGDVAYEWRLDTDAIAWTGNAAAVLGCDAAVITTGRGWAQQVDPHSGHNRFDAVTRSGMRDDGTGVPYRVEYALRCADPAPKTWVEDVGRWFAGADGLPNRAHGVVRIITERHEREANLERLAYYDGLTGEMNRNRLVETLAAAIDEATRFRNSCGFLLVAIDNLGHLNEAYGFSIADETIAQVAKRIRSQMRGGDYLGVFSGNKFGLILKNCSPDDLTIAADRLLASVRNETVPTSAGPVSVTITIGGVTAPRNARNVEETLARAQDALDLARSRRHGSFMAYKPNVEREAMRADNLKATDEIIAALNERRVALAFEPVVDATTRKPYFYEALMRVTRVDGSLAHANEIIPVAERVGLVRLLDHRVLQTVIGELRAAPGLNASVNVSPSSTNDPSWWNGLAAVLRATPGTAERLTIEITETAAIRDIDDARGFVSRVKDLGCKIAIDDFGAGHTSFRNLRKLGADILKIDGSFIQHVGRSQDDAAFVQTMLDLARRLKLKTVAEWVQDEATAQMLAAWGCDYMQGALFGLANNQRPWLARQAQAATG
jgi:diguanylate cyclase (GGDEF)-like protein